MKYLKRKTKRLVIRQLKAADFVAWKKSQTRMLPPKNTWDHGPKYLNSLSFVEFKKLLKRQNLRKTEDIFYDLFVFDEMGDIVGNVSLMQVVRGISQTAYLGYSIYNNYWGMGYGKEAVSAVIDIGFRDIKLHRIEAGIEPKNIRSLKLAKSLGMRREGIKRRAIYLRGQWVDLVVYAVTSEEKNIGFDSSKIQI